MSQVLPIRHRSSQPSELDTFVSRIARKGAQAQPLAQLQTRVPSLGPITLKGSGQFDLKVYPGPLLHWVPVRPTGDTIDVSA